MVILLALGAAVSYGVADFLGGTVSRNAAVLRVLLVSMPSGLVLLVAGSVLAGGTPTAHGLAWGFAAGVIGGLGLIGFFRALAAGPMSVVAPISALAAAVLPVMVGALRGERLDTMVLAGVVLCVIAIGLVSLEKDRPERATGSRRLLDNGPLLAGLSGATVGLFFILLHEAGSDSGLWPTVAGRVGGLTVVGIALSVLYLRRMRPIGPSGWGIPLAIVSGVLDGLANALYFVAARQGMLSLAAVLTSLYPAVTVLMARLIYAERLRAVQRVGLGVAAAGIALVTAG
jgi:uncharacterized membrane protein